MKNVCKIEERRCSLILCFARRRSGDVDFCECTNERDSMERVSNPHHRKAVRESGDQMWTVVALELNALIKIIDGFSKP